MSSEFHSDLSNVAFRRPGREFAQSLEHVDGTPQDDEAIQSDLFSEMDIEVSGASIERGRVVIFGLGSFIEYIFYSTVRSLCFAK